MCAYTWFKAKKSQLKLSSYINISSFLQRQLTLTVISSGGTPASFVTGQPQKPRIKIYSEVNYFALKNYFLKYFPFSIFYFFPMFQILCQPGIKSHSSEVMLSTSFLPHPSVPYMLLLFRSFAGKCAFIQAHSFFVVVGFFGKVKSGSGLC